MNLRKTISLVEFTMNRYIRHCTMKSIFLAVVDVEYNCSFRPIFCVVCKKLYCTNCAHTVICSTRCSGNRIEMRRNHETLEVWLCSINLDHDVETLEVRCNIVVTVGGVAEKIIVDKHEIRGFCDFSDSVQDIIADNIILVRIVRMWKACNLTHDTVKHSCTCLFKNTHLMEVCIRLVEVQTALVVLVWYPDHFVRY